MNLSMGRAFALVLFIVLAACGRRTLPGAYLFVWAGDSAHKASDFLAVIDANPASPQYGGVVATLPTGMVGTHPHHTEGEMPSNGHLLANGFHAGRTWLFDLSAPRQPKLLTSFGDLAGFSHPHTFIRLAKDMCSRRSNTRPTRQPAVHTTRCRWTWSIRPAAWWRWTNEGV